MRASRPPLKREAAGIHPARSVTAAHIPVNATRVEPGMYETPDRILYIDAAELLIANGYEPTLENQLWIGRMAQEVGNKQGKAVLHRELQGAPR